MFSHVFSRVIVPVVVIAVLSLASPSSPVHAQTPWQLGTKVPAVLIPKPANHGDLDPTRRLGPIVESQADLHGRFVVWIDNRNYPDTDPRFVQTYFTDIYLLDVTDPAKTPRRVTLSRSYKAEPTVFDNGSEVLIAWADHRNGDYDVFMCRFNPTTGACPEEVVAADSAIDPDQILTKFEETVPKVTPRGVAYIRNILLPESSDEDGSEVMFHRFDLGTKKSLSPQGVRDRSELEATNDGAIWEEDTEDDETAINGYDLTKLDASGYENRRIGVGDFASSSISGRTVVWNVDDTRRGHENDFLFNFFNLETSADIPSLQVVAPRHEAKSIRFDGQQVVYSIGNLDTEGIDLYVLNTATKQRRNFLRFPGAQNVLGFSGNTVLLSHREDAQPAYGDQLYLFDLLSPPTQPPVAPPNITLRIRPTVPADAPYMTDIFVTPGTSVELSWSATNATSCRALQDWSGTRPLSGTAIISNITSDRYFQLECMSPQGLTHRVSVSALIAAFAQLRVRTQDNRLLDPPYGGSVSVAYGSSVTLEWDTNAPYCRAAATGGEFRGWRPPTGSQMIPAITYDRTFKITCTGNSDGRNFVNISDKLTVKVGKAPTVKIALDGKGLYSSVPPFKSSNRTVLANWEAKNAVSCTASGDWSGTKPISGSEVLGPFPIDETRLYRYSLVCRNEFGGLGGRSATVSLTATSSAPSISLRIGASATGPFVEGPLSVPSGTRVYAQWTGSNLTGKCTASGNWNGEKATSGSANLGVAPASGTYTLSCTGISGQQVSDAVQVVTYPSGSNPPDLVLTQFTPSIAQPRAGQEYTIEAKIRNGGGSLSAATAIQVDERFQTVGGTNFIRSMSSPVIVPAIGVGQTITLSIPVYAGESTITSGKLYEVMGTVDPDQIVIERDEMNNSQAFSYIVPPYVNRDDEIPPNSLALSLAGPFTFPLGVGGTMQANVSNSGTETVRPFDISWRLTQGPTTLTGSAALNCRQGLDPNMIPPGTCVANVRFRAPHLLQFGNPLDRFDAGNATLELELDGPGTIRIVRSGTVSLVVPPRPIAGFFAYQSNPAVKSKNVTIAGNTGVFLVWEGTNAEYCNASGRWSGQKPAGPGFETSGSLPTGPHSYTLQCVGAGGTSDPETVTISAGLPIPSVDLKADGQSGPITVVKGTRVNFTWTTNSSQTPITTCSRSSNPSVSDWNDNSFAPGQTNKAIRVRQSGHFTVSCTGPQGTNYDTVQVIAQ